MKVLLIASTGGHLAQLVALRPAWQDHDRHWITFDKPDARGALADERVTWAYHPTTRNLPNAIRNLGLAWRVLLRDRPDVIVSSGAGVAFPFFVVARLLRIRTVYLEVFDRIELPTLTGKLCYPLADAFALQWPEQQASYPDGVLVGRAM
ncbi:PssD/Cps14F family polysaccharide biosynthesis glycosyltransferase [Nocardioides sp.]|uniref:PssD/Cps14F family polysaccharide biosynthesis glycosyltransferase n=1 Tax=Nocardioides sp. TaxID=35761 RepID=UPI0039E70B81